MTCEGCAQWGRCALHGSRPTRMILRCVACGVLGARPFPLCRSCASRGLDTWHALHDGASLSALVERGQLALRGVDVTQQARTRTRTRKERRRVQLALPFIDQQLALWTPTTTETDTHGKR